MAWLGHRGRLCVALAAGLVVAAPVTSRATVRAELPPASFRLESGRKAITEGADFDYATPQRHVRVQGSRYGVVADLPISSGNLSTFLDSPGGRELRPGRFRLGDQGGPDPYLWVGYRKKGCAVTDGWVRIRGIANFPGWPIRAIDFSFSGRCNGGPVRGRVTLRPTRLR